MTDATSPPLSERLRWSGAAAAIGFALYAATCAPGVLWQDSAMFQFRVWHADLRGDLGLPLAHPLYILLARALCLLPIGDFAWRVNLFSAMCGAATVALAMNLLLAWTGRRVAAAAGTIALGVSHTFWTHSVIAEVYNLYAVGLLVELTLLDRLFRSGRWPWLAGALFANGLNFSNHVLAVLHGPAYVGAFFWLARRRHLRWSSATLAGLAWLAGSLPYGVIILANIAEGQPVLSALWESLAGPAGRARVVTQTSFPLIGMSVKTAQYFLMNFPTPLLLLAPVGAWRLWRSHDRRPLLLFMLGVFLVDFGFAFRYRVSDQYVFFTPCYVLAALWIGAGVADLLDRWRAVGVIAMACAILPAGAYEAAPGLLKRWNVSIGVKRDIATRDAYAYFLRPRKNGDHSARRFAEAALAAAAPDGLLYADITIKNLLVYVRDVEGIERGVTLTHGPDTTPDNPVVEPTPQAIAAFAARGRAFACHDREPYVPDWMVEGYDFEAAGVVFRLVPRSTQPAQDAVPPG